MDAAPDLTALPGQPSRAWKALWWAALAASLLLVGALVALLRHQQAADLRHAEDRHELLARVLEEHAARSIDAAAAATASAAESARALLAVPGSPLSAVQTALQQSVSHQSQLRAMALLAPDGRVLAGAGTLQPGTTVDLTRLQPLPPAGRAQLLAVRPGRSLDEPAAAVRAGVGVLPWVHGVAAPEGGTAYLVALLNPDALASFQHQTLQDARLSAVLVDFDGRLVAGTRVGPGQAAALAALPPLRQLLPNTEQGSWAGDGLQPGQRLVSFRALRQYPLWVAVDEDRGAIVAASFQRVQWFMAAGAAAVVLLLAFTAGLGRALKAREAARNRLLEAQGHLAQRSLELDAVFTSVRDLLFRTDAHGRLRLVNARWSAATGRPVDACIGLPLADLVADGSRSTVAHLLRPDPDNLPRHARILIDTPTGTCHYEMTVVPLLQGQTLQGFAGSAVDVTELLNTQLKLREQLAFNDALIENSPVPLVVRDLHNRYLRVNPAWEAFTGRQRDAVVGTVAALQHAPEHSALHEQHDRALLARGDGEVRYEAPVRRADGALRNVMVSKALIRDGHGRATAIVGTFVDISELREAEQAIRAARDAAISASQAKTEFIANVSHELRTPLQAILGFSELGLMRVSAQPKLTAMFSDIHQAGQRMLGLVNELLDLSKVDRSSLQLDREPCGPLALLSAAAAELAPLAQAKELPLQLASTAGATVPVDPGRMAQVLRNLLANAIRFAPAGTAIELAAADGPSPDGRDGVTLTVADRGPGIPPGELESIFEPFVQSSLTKDGSGGTGLGLAIARRIVQAHGGTLHAANRAGGGAVFVLWLPASRIGAATTVTA